MTPTASRDESRPLAGKRIVVTRAAAAGDALADRLRTLGADVVEAPVTVIEPMGTGSLDAAIARLASYDWLILTSQVGVRMFFDALRRAGSDARLLGKTRLAVIGPSTEAALGKYGLAASIVPDRFLAEGLLETLRREPGIRTARILYPTALDARDVLPMGLRELGATVDVVAMYRSVPNIGVADLLISAIDTGRIDLVTFASGSAIESFVSLVGDERAGHVRAATIGPITSRAAQRHSVEVVAEGATATIDGLVAAIVRVDWPKRQT